MPKFAIRNGNPRLRSVADARLPGQAFQLPVAVRAPGRNSSEAPSRNLVEISGVSSFAAVMLCVSCVHGMRVAISRETPRGPAQRQLSDRRPQVCSRPMGDTIAFTRLICHYRCRRGVSISSLRLCERIAASHSSRVGHPPGVGCVRRDVGRNKRYTMQGVHVRTIYFQVEQAVSVHGSLALPAVTV